MTDAQEAHTESARASAQVLWRQRSRLVQGRVNRERLAGLESRWLANLWRLSQTTKPVLADADHLVLAAAVRVLANAPAGSLATELLGEGVEEHTDELHLMIGLLGKSVWQPVLAALVGEPECPPGLRWQLLAHFPELQPDAGSQLPASPTVETLLPGQIRYALHQGVWQEVDIIRDLAWVNLSEAFEPDLSELVLALYRANPEQARSLVDRALSNTPSSTLWLAWAAALELPEAAVTLQQAFKEGRIDAQLLALHGHTNHLDFSLVLLEQPRTNALGAQLWQVLTTETLPQVARMSVVGETPDNATAGKDTDTLADARYAREHLQHQQSVWPERQRQRRQPDALKQELSACFGRATTATVLAYRLQHPAAELSDDQSVWVRLAQLNTAEAV